MDELEIAAYPTFFAGLFAIAWADHALQPEELELLRRLMADAALPDDVRQGIEEWFEHPPAIEDFDVSRLSVAGQTLLYRNALKIAKADGVTRPSELRALQRLRSRLTIIAPVIDAIEAEDPIEPDDV